VFRQPSRSLLSSLAVAVSAIAFLVSTGVGVVWPLAWLAPIPVLVLALHRSWRAAAVVAFTASLLGDLTLARTYGPGAVLICGALAIGAVVPVTLLVILPTNKRLLERERAGSARIGASYGPLHTE